MYSSRHANEPDGLLITVAKNNEFAVFKKWSWEALVTQDGVSTKLSGSAWNEEDARQRAHRAVESVRVQVLP